MPKCALTEHIDEPKEWKNTDDDNFWMRWRLHCKGLFAFSHRCERGITWSIVFLPLTYLLPFTIWLTGWSWWYLFPVAMIPVSHQWREFPILLIGYFGKGFIRYESTNGKAEFAENSEFILNEKNMQIEDHATGLLIPVYISRIQLWCRWHIALHWPFLLTGHFYWKEADVLPEMSKENRDGKMMNGYRGYHRDADGIFWGDGASAGHFK